MNPEAQRIAIENKAAPSVDVPRLVRLYDWLRVEQHHGKTIACGGIFPAEEIKEGQKWQGSSGHAVTVESVNAHSVYYSWIERGTKMTQDKAHFAFQCRYCLILPELENKLSAPEGYAPLTCSALDGALALVDFGPCRGAERPQDWINVAGPMCAHCEGVEDVNLAAARIIAAEYRKVLAVIEASNYPESAIGDGSPDTNTEPMDQ